MKKFTVKDFITYNNPCFSCGNSINFKVSFVENEEDPNKIASSLRPVVSSEYTEIDLRITYSDSLKLYILHKTNKFLTDNSQALTDYLSSRKLFLVSGCDRCYTQIESKFLEFDFSKNLVAPVELKSELLMVRTDDARYQIVSDFVSQQTILRVDRLDKVRPLSPLTLNLPLLARYRFKDREHFLNKIKTYITFS